jgi:outer membrane lipoprotein-sorting protein
MGKMGKQLTVSAFLLIVSTLPALYAQDAASIIDSSRNRIDAKTTLTQAKMTITSKNGATSERVVNEYSKKDKNDNNRAIIEFLSPASVKGTRFMTLENKDGNDDQWIYLPSLNRVRRIASSEGSGSFMGTDMSYDDISAISSRDVDKDTHTLLREEAIDGHNCYVIQSIPKDKDFEYSKMISWIDKDSQICRKMEMYDKKTGELQKVMEVLQTTNKPNTKGDKSYLTAMATKLSTVDKGTSTTLNVLRIQYDGNVPEGAFTTRYLQTGKVN